MKQRNLNYRVTVTPRAQVVAIICSVIEKWWSNKHEIARVLETVGMYFGIEITWEEVP